jgi:hypothetical protein
MIVHLKILFLFKSGLNNVPLHVYLSVDIWVASTPLVTVNNAPMKMSVQLSLQKHISFPEKSI